MEKTETRCDMAVAILQCTNDGEDLDPAHLWLVQEWVNGGLNEKGEVAFRELHAAVTAGNYHKPWLHGVENLTRDHQGYIYWKGIRVEHCSFYGDGDQEQQKAAAEELGRRCQLLESKGIQPTTKTVVWDWDDSKNE